ncbi:MAG: HEPN domain-containing protein [Terriglobia bacterium]
MTSAREIPARLNRAKRTLKAAQTMLTAGFPEEAVSRAYYAMFYAASAMHRAEGRIYRRHDSLIGEFGKYFVISGKVRREFHESLRNAFGLRKSADYESFLEGSISAAEAEALVDQAFEFVMMAERFLEGLGDKN